MKPVDQQFFYNKETGEIGDCVRAVTASLLELDIKEVPHFVKEKPGFEWYEDWEQYMKQHGINVVMIPGPFDKPPIPTGYYIASGPANRDCKHVVIMWDGKLAHDPHPSRDGLLSIEAVWVLC